jgi:hypothetical protein
MSDNNSSSGGSGIGAIILLILLFSSIAAPFLGAIAVIAGILLVIAIPVGSAIGVYEISKKIEWPSKEAIIISKLDRVINRTLNRALPWLVAAIVIGFVVLTFYFQWISVER